MCDGDEEEGKSEAEEEVGAEEEKQKGEKEKESKRLDDVVVVVVGLYHIVMYCTIRCTALYHIRCYIYIYVHILCSRSIEFTSKSKLGHAL